MARKGKLSTSKVDKENFASYKLGNRVQKNKIKKLERHCKRFPKDEFNQKNLERLRKSGFKHSRGRPLNPGINKDVNVAMRTIGGIPMEEIETAGEQLSRLLGIPLRTPRYNKKPGKTAVRYKKKKNVGT